MIKFRMAYTSTYERSASAATLALVVSAMISGCAASPEYSRGNQEVFQLDPQSIAFIRNTLTDPQLHLPDDTIEEVMAFVRQMSMTMSYSDSTGRAIGYEDYYQLVGSERYAGPVDALATLSFPVSNQGTDPIIFSYTIDGQSLLAELGSRQDVEVYETDLVTLRNRFAENGFIDVERTPIAVRFHIQQVGDYTINYYAVVFVFSLPSGGIMEVSQPTFVPYMYRGVPDDRHPPVGFFMDQLVQQSIQSDNM